MMRPASETISSHPGGDGRIDLSIVVPSHNEIDTIREVVQRVSKIASEVATSYEIVVVDDGSTDDTYRQLRSIEKTNEAVTVIKVPVNKGKGNAVKAAAEVVRGNAVIVIDADMEIDPSSVREYVEALKYYDVCIASKRHPDSLYDAPFVRKFLSIGFNKVIRLLTGIKFSDSQTGLKAMRGEHFRRILNVITVKRYAYDVEILAVAELLDLKVAEFPIRIIQTSAFSKKAMMYMLIDLLGIAYRLKVIKWYQKNLDEPSLSYKPIIPI